MIQIATPSMGEEELNAVKECLESGWVTQGPKVQQFEENFAKMCESNYAVATSSCTTALHLALLALGIGKGDGVLVPSFTWIATANAVEYCGATPIFCDIELDYLNIDIYDAENKIRQAKKNGINVKAIIPVHFAGVCADMQLAKELASIFRLRIIEDAACASGSKYFGRYAGTVGDIGCFSFHPRKVLVTGEGGMCITNNEELFEKLRQLRNHGSTMKPQDNNLPEFNVLGYNYRMTDIQAAIGIVQLSKLSKFISERQKWAKFYQQELQLPWLKTPKIPTGTSTSWQSFVCMVEGDRNKIMNYLQEKGISTRPGTHAVHMLSYYRKKYNLQDSDLPKAKLAYEQSIALPLHNQMTEIDYQYVVDMLRNYGG